MEKIYSNIVKKGKKTINSNHNEEKITREKYGFEIQYLPPEKTVSQKDYWIHNQVKYLNTCTPKSEKSMILHTDKSDAHQWWACKKLVLHVPKTCLYCSYWMRHISGIRILTYVNMIRTRSSCKVKLRL